MLRKLIYPAVFLQSEDGITISFPDLPGCISEADSLEEAFDQAKEAMELYLEDYVDDFSKAPKASKLKNIPLEKNECLALIELDLLEYLATFDQTPIKKTLTIPSYLNELGLKRQLNFSKILANALLEEIYKS